tara:strand:- start:358 stop:681 length:324 start_codon:yes stop_codon:yes gene_type:complete
MKAFKIYPFIIVLFISLSVFNIAHADCNISDKNALKGKNLSGCELVEADLTDTDLTGAYLGLTFLIGADLTGADFQGAKFENKFWWVDTAHPDGIMCSKKILSLCVE